MCLFISVSFLTACGGGGGGGTAVVPVAPVNTEVSFSSVANNSTGVSKSLSAIQINFTNDMEPVSTAAAFSIAPPLNGIVNVTGKILTYNITEELNQGTNYIITIGTTAKDTDGKVLTSAYTLSFRTEGSSISAPSSIADLSVKSASIFGILELGFTAPAPGTDTISVYLVKYSPAPLTEANFDTAATAFSLPANTIPTPGNAGTTEKISVNVNNLTGVYRGEKIYFAIKSQNLTGDKSNISNSANMEIPWFLNVKFIRKINTASFTTLKLGAQLNGLDSKDSFDEELPPVLPGNLGAYVKLSGRVENLIKDIRAPFGTVLGTTKSFTIVINGSASEVLTVEFPEFNTSTPLYTFKLDGTEISGNSMELSLSAGGLKEIVISITN